MKDIILQPGDIIMLSPANRVPAIVTRDVVQRKHMLVDVEGYCFSDRWDDTKPLTMAAVNLNFRKAAYIGRITDVIRPAGIP